MKTRRIGLELTDQAIYLLDFSSKRGSTAIKRAEVIHLPDEVISGGELKDFQVLKEVLAQFFTQKFFSFPIPVVAGISGQQAFIRKIDIPVVPYDEIAEVVRWEGENILPCPISEVYYHYQVLRQKEANYQILFTAIQKDRLEKYRGLFRELQIPVKILTLLPFGLVNYVESVGESSQYSGVLARVRRASIELVILSEGQLEIIRVIPIPTIYHNERTVEFFLTELNSTIAHFHSLKDFWLERGIFFGEDELFRKIKGEMPLFHWRHFQLESKALPNKDILQTELRCELPGTLGLGLMGVGR